MLLPEPYEVSEIPDDDIEEDDDSVVAFAYDILAGERSLT